MPDFLQSGDAFYPTAFNKLNALFGDSNSSTSLVTALSSSVVTLSSTVVSIALPLTSTVIALSSTVVALSSTLTSNVVALSSTLTSSVVSLSSAVASITSGLTTNRTAYNTTYTTSQYSEGSVFWDGTNHTLIIQLGLDSINLQVGQEEYIIAVNKTNAQINNGTPVYISGAQGNRPKIWLSSASSMATAKVCGVATMNIPNNQEGVITTTGVVNDIDTSEWTEGDYIYTSMTGGRIINYQIPNTHQDKIGVVLYSNASNGKILVKPTTGFDLSQLHDLSVTAAQTGDILTKNGSTPTWVSSSSIHISGDISSSGNTYSLTSKYFYFGNPNTDGTWRFGISGNNFIHQRRESSNWITKQTITA